MYFVIKVLDLFQSSFPQVSAINPSTHHSINPYTQIYTEINPLYPKVCAAINPFLAKISI